MNTATTRFDMPFVVFLGDASNPIYAKTALGMVDWRGRQCAGQMRLSGCTIALNIPELSIADAKRAGVRSLIVGCAAIGGGIPESWVRILREAARAGIDIVAGLHIRLSSLPGLADAALAGSARLIDVRSPPAGLPVGTGVRRSGKRLLTVGTDCACGKKYTALAVEREMRARGLNSDFRATGQTGIMIAGGGIPMDAVVSDFLTGAAEIFSPANDPGHWDVIEGQGAIFHPGFLQVTIGLLVGSQPDAFIVCHDPVRETVSGWPDFPLPTIDQVIERTVLIGGLTNPGIRCVGLALNTSSLLPSERLSILRRHAEQTSLPCVDPLIDGVAPIVDRIQSDFRL